jgi:uncharacterized protein YndB with AHSA1/START domain
MTLDLIDPAAREGATTMPTQQLGNDRTTVSVDGLAIVFEHVFDAPRDLVWRVMTDPTRITNWWGPRGYTTTVEEMDVRPGGRWRFINHTTAGEDVPFRGEYLEVVPGERIVRTFIVDIPGMDDKVGLETMTLEDLGDRTKLVERSRFDTLEELEGQIAVGMVGGALDTYDRLAEEIAKG